MAKMKVTRRPTTQDYVLKPDRVRLFYIYVIVFILAIALGTGIRWLFTRFPISPNWFQQNGLFTVLLILIGSLVMSFTEYSRWTIRIIKGESLEGPSGMFGDRLTIPVKQIDWKRTQRSLSSWFKIGNCIYDTSRRRILVSPWFFKPARFRELIDLLGPNT